VLPYVVQKIEENPDEQLLWKAIDEIAKVKIHAKYDEVKNMAVFPDFPDVKPGEDVYVYWCKEGHKQTPQKFQELYSEWRNLGDRRKENQRKSKFVQIHNLGLAAIPVIMEKVREGDKELLLLVSELTGGKVYPNVTIDQCFAWWQQNKEDWLIPFPNKRPIANAGQEMIVNSGATVQLDGSASTDADKDILSYQWRQIAGPEVKLSDKKSTQPSFIAPKVDKETVLVFELVVNDGSPIKEVHPSCQSGQSEPDTVTITIKPKK